MKTVFFDLGGVLIDFSHEKMCAQLAKVAGIPEETIQKLFFEDKIQDLYEKGLIDSQYLHFKLSQVAKKQLDFHDVMLAISKIFKPIPKTIELLDALKVRGTRLVLLSNTCEAHFDYAKKTYPFLRKFDAYLLSYKVALRKPDPKIFAMALTMTKSSPLDCLYVDDVQNHTIAAEKLGLPAHHYTDTDTLVKELRTRQFLA